MNQGENIVTNYLFRPPFAVLAQNFHSNEGKLLTQLDINHVNEASIDGREYWSYFFCSINSFMLLQVQHFKLQSHIEWSEWVIRTLFVIQQCSFSIHLKFKFENNIYIVLDILVQLEMTKFKEAFLRRMIQRCLHWCSKQNYSAHLQSKLIQRIRIRVSKMPGK